MYAELFIIIIIIIIIIIQNKLGQCILFCR